MDRALDVQIRYQIERYVSGGISLDDFRNWFVPRAWNIEESGDQPAIQLAHRIDGILGESSSANWSEDGLREELANAVHSFVHQG